VFVVFVVIAVVLFLLFACFAVRFISACLERIRAGGRQAELAQGSTANNLLTRKSNNER
jgi:hypothetical protein